MTSDDVDDRCEGGEDGCAGTASTAMRVAPRSPGPFARGWALFALWWCGLAWWPLLRWARRGPDGSAPRRALAWVARVAPWAFRAVLVPRVTGGDVIPLRDGRTLERGQAFGGDIHASDQCAPARGLSILGPPRLRTRVRRSVVLDGRCVHTVTVGWRAVRSGRT